MSNMSYCKFENTLPDVEDCLNAVEDGDTLSEREYKCACRMLQVAKELAKYDEGDLVKEDEDE